MDRYDTAIGRPSLHESGPVPGYLMIIPDPMRRAAAGPVPGYSGHLTRQPDGVGISWNCQHRHSRFSRGICRCDAVGLRGTLIAVSKMSRSSGENIRPRIRCDEKCTRRRLTVRSTDSRLSDANFMTSRWHFHLTSCHTGSDNCLARLSQGCSAWDSARR